MVRKSKSFIFGTPCMYNILNLLNPPQSCFVSEHKYFRLILTYFLRNARTRTRNVFNNQIISLEGTFSLQMHVRQRYLDASFVSDEIQNKTMYHLTIYLFLSIMASTFNIILRAQIQHYFFCTFASNCFKYEQTKRHHTIVKKTHGKRSNFFRHLI